MTINLGLYVIGVECNAVAVDNHYTNIANAPSIEDTHICERCFDCRWVLDLVSGLNQF